MKLQILCKIYFKSVQNLKEDAFIQDFQAYGQLADCTTQYPIVKIDIEIKIISMSTAG